MTNAEARFTNSLSPRKPEEGSLGRTAQDVNLDSHTDPELCFSVILIGLLYNHVRACAFRLFSPFNRPTL